MVYVPLMLLVSNLNSPPFASENLIEILVCDIYFDYDFLFYLHVTYSDTRTVTMVGWEVLQKIKLPRSSKLSYRKITYNRMPKESKQSGLFYKSCFRHVNITYIQK